MLAYTLAQLPGMIHAARRTHALVAAQHDEPLEALLLGAFRICQAVVHRMLAGQKGHDRRSRNVCAQVDDQMAQVVLFLETDSTVSQEYKSAAPGQAADSVVRVDPGIHARAGFELGAGWAQFCGDDR